jgi:hypothetical protein
MGSRLQQQQQQWTAAAVDQEQQLVLNEAAMCVLPDDWHMLPLLLYADPLPSLLHYEQQQQQHMHKVIIHDKQTHKRTTRLAIPMQQKPLAAMLYAHLPAAPLSLC